MTRADYVESSALAKLVTLEREAPDLVQHLASASTQVTSVLAVTEVGRAALRRGGGTDTISAAILGRFILLDIDRRVIDHAARLGPATLRTLDAIHLASAMQLGPELRSFVTYDRRLATAARDAGLPVASPGMPPD